MQNLAARNFYFVTVIVVPFGMALAMSATAVFIGIRVLFLLLILRSLVLCPAVFLAFGFGVLGTDGALWHALWGFFFPGARRLAPSGCADPLAATLLVC